MELEEREGFTNCLVCTDLERNLKAALAQYIEAFYRVSIEFAALKRIDMEAIEASMREHKLVCPFAARST